MFGVFVLLHTARWIATLLGFSCCCTFFRTGCYSLKVSMLCNDVDNDADICMDDVGEDVDDVHANDPNQFCFLPRITPKPDQGKVKTTGAITTGSSSTFAFITFALRECFSKEG